MYLNGLTLADGVRQDRIGGSDTASNDQRFEECEPRHQRPNQQSTHEP
jgi:hypothetical protein